ncbi:MAG: iron ABC transporter permease [Acidobacteria bacterium]|nr:iron ABC transporter permease [Acidobacteriota bacterium]
MSRSTNGEDSAPLALRTIGIVLAITFAFPGAYLVWRNFTEDADPTGLLFSSATVEPMLRTLRLAVSVSVAAAGLGTSLAWFSTRTDLPMAQMWRVLLPLPLVFPTFIGAAAFIRTLNPGGLGNDVLSDFGVDQTPELSGFFGAWLVLTLFTFPYVYLPVAARLRQLPGSFEDSARVLGDSAARAVAKTVLPHISGSVAAGTLLVFLYTISDFGAVQLMRYDTLTRAIETNYLARPPTAFALSLVLMVMAALVVAAERLVSRRLPVMGAARSSRAVQYRLGRWRWPCFGAVFAAAALSLGAPTAALVDWASDGLLRERRGGRPLTIDADKVLEATVNTLTAGVLTALAAALAVIPIAYLLGRYRDRIGSLSHAVVIATFALPGILIALALRFWTIKAGPAGDLLYDTLALLIFAYTVRFASLAMGVTLVAVRSIPAPMRDVAATLGAKGPRRLASIDLPLMTPGILAGAGLVLMSTMKELPISLIVAPIGFPTLTTRIFGSFEDAFVAEAGIMAVVLVAISALLSWFLVLRRADHF